MEKLTMLDFIKKANTSEVRKRMIPMELSPGWPAISIKSSTICVSIPFLRTQLTEDKKVALFPLSSLLVLTWPNMAIAEFSVLKFKKEYSAIDYTKPVGVFKHEAIKDLNKKEYAEKRDELYSFYDELIDCIVNKKDFKREAEMRELFQLLMEPSLYPMYKHLFKNFFEVYCGLEDSAK